MVKRIKLFGITIWEIETIEDPESGYPEEEEETTGGTQNLGTHLSTPTDPPPTFGFITNWSWDDE